MYAVSKKLIGLSFVLLLVAGCDSNDTQEGEAPGIPDPFIFNFFPDLFLDNVNVVNGANFEAASARIDQINNNIGTTLLLPFTLTALSLQASPFQSNGNWVWQDVAFIAEQPHVFELIARPVDDTETDWTMNVTGPDLLSGIQLTNFTLFTIRADTDQNGAWSLFFIDPNGATQFAMSGMYAVVSDTEWNLQFNISQGFVSGAGDVITFTRSGTTLSYTWAQADPELTHELRWNVDTGSGSVISPVYNGGEESCWDSALNDTDC